MFKFPAADVKVKRIRVYLLLKNRNLRSSDILNNLRPSVILELPGGKCRTLIMDDWLKSPNEAYVKLEMTIRRFSGDKPEACYDASVKIWKRVKATVYAESRKSP
jgi:hypothetical protein